MILLQKYFDYNKKKVDSNSLKFLNMKLNLQKELDNNKKLKIKMEK